MADGITKLYATYNDPNSSFWSVVVADVRITRGITPSVAVSEIVFNVYRDDLPDEETARGIALFKNHEAAMPSKRVTEEGDN